MSGLMLRLVIKLYLTNYIGFGIGFIHLVNLIMLKKPQERMSVVIHHYSLRDQSYRAISIRELVDQVFNPRNVMCALDLRQGQNVTVALIFLGCLSMYQVDEHNAACTKS
ncbi:unnamed protein product [Rotaria socialis]